MKRFRLLVALAPLALEVFGFAGCGNNADDSLAVKDTGSDTTINDGSPSFDAAKDAPTTDAPSAQDAGNAMEIVGNVTFFQAKNGGSSTLSSATFAEIPVATFACGAEFANAASPSAATAGCTIFVCTSPIDAGSVATDASALNPGKITLRTALNLSGYNLTPKPDGTYPTSGGPGQFWTVGDTTVEVKAAGATIPAFDETGMIAPADLTAVSLGGTNVLGSASIAFGRSGNLAVTYAGGTAGTTTFVTLGTTSSSKRVSIQCDFDAANGAQSIASGDLQNLEQADGTTVLGVYAVWGHDLDIVTDGGRIQLELSSKQFIGSFTNGN